MSWTSPWDGADRRAIPIGVAAVAAFDAIHLVIARLGAGRSGTPRADAPAWLDAIADAPLVAIALGVAALAALGLFARGRRPIASGLVALVSIGILVEVDAARAGGPWRGYFAAGAALAGALAGLTVARFGRADPRTRLRLLEAGAVAALAATWVGAAIGKLAGAGLGWTDADTLRAVVLAHAHVDDMGRIARWVVDSPALARALAIGTIVAQLGAFAWPLGRRSRMLCGAMLVAFHLGVAMATRIGYWQPVALVLLFSLPWARLTMRLREPGGGVPEPRLDASARSGMLVVIAAAAALALAGATTTLSRYGHGHHRAQSDDAGQHEVDRFGPLARRDALGDGWTIATIVVERERAAIVIEKPAVGRALLWVAPRREGEGRAGPFDNAVARVSWGTTALPLGTIDAPAREVSRRIAAHAASRDDVTQWLDEN